MNDRTRTMPLAETSIALQRNRVRRICRLVREASHDFRAPLAVINEYAALLRQGPAEPRDDEQKRLLHVIEDRADDLNDMVEDLLNASRIETETLGFYGRSCRLADIIDKLRPRLARKAQLKGFEWRFEIPADLPEIYCDQEQIGRVIVRLAAIAARRARQPVRLQVWARIDPLCREVTVGISEKPAATDSLYRSPMAMRRDSCEVRVTSANNARRALKVAREIVRLNLGELIAKGEVDEGDVAFQFTIPVNDPLEVVNRYVDRVTHAGRRARTISILKVVVATGIDEKPTQDINAYLDALLHPRDLILRLDRRRWMLAAAGSEQRIERLLRDAAELRRILDRSQSGRQLSAIEMVTLGTWRVPDEASRLLETVGDVLA